MTNDTCWKTGTAAAVITPGEPMWLAGWAARREPALDAAEDLFVKALALEDGAGHRAVLVTAELIAFPVDLARMVASEVHRRWNIPRANLLFNASHTHTGPEVRPDKVPFFEIPPEFARKIQPYAAELLAKTTGVIGAALARLQPARITVHEAQAAFGHNRRPGGGPVDPAVPVLTACDLEQKLLAVVFGYACHNLTLSPSFRQFHGDYAGVAQRLLEAELPGATALFIAGAGADQEPSPRGTLVLAEAHGRALASAVQQILTQPGRAVSPMLQANFEEVTLDFQPVPGAATLKADLDSEDGPRRRKAKFLLNAIATNQPFPASYPCPVQVWRLGEELLLLALGGEPMAEFALQFKKEFAGPLVWVAGYSNDMFGYLPTRRVQREGGYEGGRAILWSALPAPFTETAEERVTQAVRRLVGGSTQRART